jgi:hypothetical protein
MFARSLPWMVMKVVSIVAVGVKWLIYKVVLSVF